MNITLKGDILILDEAHNIEDSCREAAGLSVVQDQIFDAIKDCEEAVEYTENKQPFYKLVSSHELICFSRVTGVRRFWIILSS